MLHRGTVETSGSGIVADDCIGSVDLSNFFVMRALTGVKYCPLGGRHNYIDHNYVDHKYKGQNYIDSQA